MAHLSILIPVYNEQRTLRRVLQRVLAVEFPVSIEVIVVDDVSTDSSAAIIRELAERDKRIRPVFLPKNLGKAGAIHAAIKEMRGEIAIVQDADLEYDPADIPRVIQPILDGRADAVFGTRFAGGHPRRVHYYWHTLANRFLTWVTNFFADLNLTDMQTCYKAVRADILRQTPLHFQRFALEAELTVRLSQWGIRIFEVPISYAGRTYPEGKKVTWKDGLHALFAVLWCVFVNDRFTDHDGYYILVAVRNATGFNRWMYSQLRPYVGQAILEAGCGIGNLTEQLISRDRLIAADLDPLYVEMIQRRFGHLENFRSIHMDLVKSEDYKKVAAEKLDTIICLNVLEHLQDDIDVLGYFHRVLEPGGHAIILVPKGPWLHNSLDVTLGHYRRYTTEELQAKLEKAGFEVVHKQGFNRLGVLGWFVNGSLLGKKHLTPGAMRMFNRVLPIAKLIEWIPGLPSLSVIAVGKKPTEKQ